MNTNTIIKRDGRVVKFDSSKIENAISKCFKNGAIEYKTGNTTIRLTEQVLDVLGSFELVPTVEQVQDIVERVLQANGEYEAAKQYILYRAEHGKARGARPIPEDVRQAFATARLYFPTQLQEFQFFDKYSRFDYRLGRRETWVETVNRTVSFLHELAGARLPQEDYERIRLAILEMRVMPSMRLLATAGEAARRQNISVFNCSYLPVDSPDSFVEAMIISMAGCGVGYSVESEYVSNLPRITKQYPNAKRGNSWVVEDSSEGWADALAAGLDMWFGGGDIDFDFSLIRKAGAILRTKGGRASGPQPLKDLLKFTRARILARQGLCLRTIDAHDIMCEIGYASIAGGSRRAAMISLFDFDDRDMRECKTHGFERENPQRWNANNSVVWPENGISQVDLVDQMLTMVKNFNGEPGIFNRDAARRLKPERRKDANFGLNPCGEVVMRPFGFCNLSSIVARKDDTLESLTDKAEIAAIIGTIQSLATYYPGLRPRWQHNAVEERLLGVSLSGQLDSKAAQDSNTQNILRSTVIATNQEYATKKLGITPSVAATVVKPAGNEGVLTNSASGIHARWAPYYIRNVRVFTHSPLFRVLKGAGVPMQPENGQQVETANTWVVSFPVKSPDGAITRNDRTAIEQCDYWLQVKQSYTEHNPSVTITYHPNEVIDLIKWVNDHKDLVGGMAFLPASDIELEQLPYIEITEAEYTKLQAAFPVIDFSKIYRYELEDYTTAAQEVACSAGGCDL